MAVNISIFGDKELERKLAALENKMQNKLVRGALKQAAEIVLAESKARAPVDTGALKESLRVFPSNGRGKIGFKIAPDSLKLFGRDENGDQISDARAIATEYGTVKDSAQPWLRPAIDSKRDECLRLIENEIRSELEAA